MPEAQTKQHYNDFLAGSVAGMASKLFEFPFDTIKVLQQTKQIQSTKSARAGEILVNVVKTNGIRGLYNGLATPLISCTFETAVLFYVYQKSKSFLTSSLPFSNSIWTIAAAGGIAGAFTPFIVTPVEFVKCNLQIQDSTLNRKFSGPLDCVTKTVKEKGISGIYKGYFATVLRESPGSSLWFVAYELSSRFMLRPGQTKEDLPLWKLMVSGSFSGMAYWTAFFPADVIKSQLQTGKVDNESFWSVFRRIWKTSGLHGLYRGFGVTMFRAIPSNGILFASYEACSRLLNVVNS